MKLAVKRPMRLMTYLKEHKATCLILMALLLNLILESLCRRSPLGGVQFLLDAPLPFLYGAGVILLTLSLSGLFRRRYFCLLLVSILWLGLGVIECVIKGFRITPLTAIDFRIIFSVFSILNIYLNVFEVILICASFAGVLALLTWAFLTLPKDPPVDFLRAGLGCIASGLLVWGSTVLFLSSGLLASEFENLGTAYDDYGFAYCFSCSLFSRGISEPETYSPEEVETVVEELDETEPAPEPAAAAVKPNIIVLQLESYFDVNYLKNYTYSKDPVPVFTELKRNYSTGFLTVPSIGAGTANTEFEVITGMSLDYFGTGEYPYETVLQSNVCESVCYGLKEEGYSTHAIHNHTATFYDRNLVYANLGFDTFTPLEYMKNTHQNAIGWAEDAVLTGEILKTLRSTVEEDFIYTISVQAHGKYPTEVVDDTQTITMSGLEDGPQKIGIEYYLNQLHETDAFVGELIDAVNRLDEPTVVVLFGDHLPNFTITQEELEQGNLLQTEYVVWSNFGMEKQDKNLEAYQLLANVMGRIGYTDGVLTKLHQDAENNADYQKRLEMLEYDILYGDQYAYDGQLPFEPTQLRLGVEDILVTAVANIHDDVYVSGKNFTVWSKVAVNGTTEEDTLFINENTLLLPGTQLIPGDSIMVTQVTKKHVDLGQTEPYIYR